MIKTRVISICVAVLAAITLILSCIQMLCNLPTIVHSNAEAISSSAKGMAVVDSEGNIIFEKNMNLKCEPASTTKICTAITVLDRCFSLNREVTVPDCAIGVEGSSIYLERGEKVKVIDLLYGLMLRSGNDCAVALAVLFGDSVEGFAKLMNETAVKAGAINTNFANPHGLHDSEHYTTAYDLAKITAYAMKNPIFKRIVSTKRYEMSYNNKPYNRILYNKNKILNEYEGGDGVKTGYTKAAGRCLVSSATRGGKSVIAVVFNCSDMFPECKRLMTKAFEKLGVSEVKNQDVFDDKQIAND